MPTPFAEAVLALENVMSRPVWVLIEGGRPPFDEIDGGMSRAFFGEREQMKDCQGPPALLIDSLGGQAGSAYRIASLFRRHCGEFAAVIPRMAKSAATLLALGASEIYLGSDAELGPLDAQLWDTDREEYSSALDEVQALERLNSVALDVVDQAMFLLINRTGKKTGILLPPVLHFAAELMQPLLDKIDTVHYTQLSRVLKVAEDYATRLLQPMYSEDDAKAIARHLVNAYSEHGFAISREELGNLLTESLVDADPQTQSYVDRLEELLVERQRTFSALGRIERRDAANGRGSE
ncbi:MAG: hypothetical protein ABSC56_04615 [Solirubrobacteraceae bacterium]